MATEIEQISHFQETQAMTATSKINLIKSNKVIKCILSKICLIIILQNAKGKIQFVNAKTI